MSQAEYDVTGIGNALVDVLTPVNDDFLKKHPSMKRGFMQLINQDQAVALYDELEAEREVSGGSVANTIAGLASFGGKCAFIGKVADDTLGNVFGNDLKKMDIRFETQPLVLSDPTGRCLILVTPDAERTMNTYLGASVELGPDDIDPNLIASSQITYLEGYLFDPPSAKQAYIKAAELAHEAGHRVALTLSDPFCVERHRDDFQKLVEKHTDILFANEEEIISLYKSTSFEEAAQHIGSHCEIAVLTRSNKGSVIISNEGQHIIEAEPTNLLDTTGAGDQYAAGFLYGFTQCMPLEKCGKLGALAAAEVISHIGPRPEISYKDFLKKV